MELQLKLTGMKKLMMVLAVGSFAMLQSCEQDPTEVTIDEVTIEAESIMESDFDEIDELSDLGMEISQEAGGRASGERDDRMTCAVVTVDRENLTITIDFGDGCTDPRGRTRSGKIIIVHSEFWYEFGGTITTTLENYVVNERAIEGTRVVTN